MFHYLSSGDCLYYHAFIETSRTSAWLEVSWTAQGRPLMPAALFVTLGLKTVRGEPQSWSCGLPVPQVQAVTQQLERLEYLPQKLNPVRNLHGSLQTAQFQEVTSGERYMLSQKKERLLHREETRWRLMEVWGKGEYWKEAFLGERGLLQFHTLPLSPLDQKAVGATLLQMPLLPPPNCPPHHDTGSWYLSHPARTVACEGAFSLALGGSYLVEVHSLGDHDNRI